MLQYLGKLKDRMRCGFPPDHPFLRNVREAYNAVHGFNVTLHYMSCAGGSERNQFDSAVCWRRSPAHRESTRGGWLEVLERAEKRIEEERRMLEGMRGD